jgi:D-beta-D-heptose 7-phosphate kinase/D-beta-D-heptose 1-phosphate adenosyltransferase
MHVSLPASRLDQLLMRARHKRIVVVGDAMLDVYLKGDVERISPEAPVPVVKVTERRHALGGASNVAQNVVAIGCDCELVAAIGADAGGERLRDMLGQIGVQTCSLLEVDRPTTQKTRIVARSQQLVRVDEEDDSNLAAEDRERLVLLMRDAIQTADALVLEDYNKGVLVPEVIEAAIAAARARAIPIVVDPKFRNFFSYAGATIFKPNLRELEAALGATIDLEHPEALPSMLARLGVANILLTLGERGMVLFGAEHEPLRIPTAAREVFDVVGAGDTVTAFLAGMLAAGATPSEAATIANTAAGIEVGKLGAATVTPEELLAYLASETGR